MNKYDVKYFHCPGCGFLQTEEPYWLTEAYSESINMSDTGYLLRNISLSKLTTAILPLLFNRKGKFLDYAGGYGVYVRLMRDIGFDFRWQDKYTPNLFAREFEWKGEKVEAITTFESFEHFVDPMKEVEDMLTISKSLIFTTELLPEQIPKPNEWWYYGLDHGQHISLYSVNALKYIADHFGLNYLNYGSFHIITEKNISKKMLALLIRLNRIKLNAFLAKFVLKGLTWKDYLQVSQKK
jgi:hypothetical protein